MNYRALARRDGAWWVVQCVEEPDAITQVSDLNQADEYLRESLAFVTGVPVGDVGILNIEVV